MVALFESVQDRVGKFRNAADSLLLTVFKNIKPLTFEILETWRVGEAQQVAGGKYRLTISKGIGGMDVTPVSDLWILRPMESIPIATHRATVPESRD
jgi:hypothetical protein